MEKVRPWMLYFPGGGGNLPLVACTPCVEEGKPEETTFTLPRIDLLSVESSPSAGADARLKVRLAHLQLEMQEKQSSMSFRGRKNREFQHQGELEIKKNSGRSCY